MRVIALLALVTGCGTSCPTDDCTVKPRTFIKWTFDKYPERMFPMDSCVDFGAEKVSVTLTDGAGIATTLKDDCGIAQVVFEDLTPGRYHAAVTPLGFDGNPLVTAPINTEVTVGDTDGETTVNVPWESWAGTYTGTFLFRISWGGLSCDTATPVIKNQVLTLTVNGVVQNITTDDGQALNGSDKKPCKKLSDEFPQSAKDVMFGPATFVIEGYDATDNMKFTKSFDTFVGAGITNPTLTFDVPMP